MAYNQITNVYGPVNQSKFGDVARKKPKFFGLNYPIGKYQTSRGYFGKTTGLETIENGVRQLLLTERGERVMLPGFGCNLRKFLFQPLDDITFEQIKEEIATSIRKYTRDVKIVKLGVFDLDKISETGSQALKVVVLLQLRDDTQNQFEVEVILQ
jgi:phage baseplate assembly protein W